MKVEFGGEPAWLAVISAGRPDNVGPMHELLGVGATWYVPRLQRADYEKGGTSTRHDTGSLSGGRQAALEEARQRGLICLQLDDDLKKIQMAVEGKGVDATADEAFGELLSRLAFSDFRLGGVAPTNNAYFSKDKATSTNLFIIGSCCATKPSTSVRWREDLKLKEDYAFTADHILQDGGVLRCDNVLLSFAHYTNKGGAVDVRTVELEQRAIALLLRDYPGLIKPHPRRENEVLLRAPKAKKSAL
jgi:hypothetical protein